MDSIRITQLPTKSAAGTDDYIAVDSTANGTKKIQFPNLLDNGLTIQNKAADAKATGDAINNEAFTRQSTDTNLQTQIDQIIAPSGEAPSAAEVENARIGAPPESTVYPSLGDAIRGQVTDLKSEISDATGNIFYPFAQKQAIATSGDTSTLVPAIDNDTDCAVISCAEGDTFTISGEGWNAFRLWAFLGAESNSTYPVLDKSAGGAVANKLLLTAPTGAEYLVVNAKRIPTNYSGSVCKNKLLAITVSEIKNEVESGFDAINEELTAKEKIFGVPSENASVITTTGKLYNVTTKTEVAFSNGRYSVLDNFVAGAFYEVSGYSFSSNDLYPLYALYDSNNNLLETYGEPNTAYDNVFIHIADNVSKIVVTGSNAYPPSIKNYTPTDLKTYIDNGFVHNIWSGKRVGILGTSVAFGALATKSYPFEASELLGYQLSMFAVPGLAIEQASDGTPKEYGSFTCSIADYEADGWTIPSAPITPYVPGGSYNDYYRTYENVFVQDNADIDLWVYAVVPNNTNFALDDWNAFNKTEWKYNDDSAFSTHCKTFLGALIFIMNQMYTLNPNARMVFAIDSTFSYANGLEALQTVSAQWNIPIINLWGKINISPKSLIKLKSENGTNSHPSTFAHEIMGKMFAGELELIS